MDGELVRRSCEEILECEIKMRESVKINEIYLKNQRNPILNSP